MNPALPDDKASREGTRDWPHAPPHRLGEGGVYYVTARTLDHILYFRGPERLTFVRDHLFAMAEKYHWRLEAWAVLANHYHIVAHSAAGETTAATLRTMLTNFHADVTRHFNRLDGTPGRKIWHNFRETHLTFQRSYLARLNYTHNNPVHHRLVPRACDYQWCSARDFENAATPAWVKTIESFKCDEIAKDEGDE